MSFLHPATPKSKFLYRIGNDKVYLKLLHKCETGIIC